MLFSQSTLPHYRGESTYYTRFEVTSAIYDLIAAERARKFGRWLTPKMRVFEFGVGSGFNLAQLRCRSRVGYDVSCPFWHLLNRKKIWFRWDTESIKTGSFDGVICHHTLEHMPDPWSALGEMQRLLAVGGLLIVHVPYEIESTHQRFDPTEPNKHLFSWTPQTIGTLLTSRGFDLVETEMQKFGYDRFAAVLARRLHGGNRMYRLLRWALLTLRPRYEIYAVCRKK